MNPPLLYRIIYGSACLIAGIAHLVTAVAPEARASSVDGVWWRYLVGGIFLALGGLIYGGVLPS